MNVIDDNGLEVKFPRTKLIGVHKMQEKLQLVIELDKYPSPITLLYSSLTSLNNAFYSLFVDESNQQRDKNPSSSVADNSRTDQIQKGSGNTKESDAYQSGNLMNTATIQAKNTVVTVAAAEEWLSSNARDFVAAFKPQLSTKGIDLTLPSEPAGSTPSKLLVFVREESRAVDTPTAKLEQKIKDLAAKYALSESDVALLLWPHNYTGSPNHLEFPSRRSYRVFYLDKGYNNSSLNALAIANSMVEWIKSENKVLQSS